MGLESMTPDDAWKRVRELLDRVETFIAENNSSMRALGATTINKGDLTVKGGASVVLQEGGDVKVSDGGSIEALGGYVRATDSDGVGAVQMDGASYYLLPEVDDLTRFGYLRVDKGEDAGNNLRMRPPQDPARSGSPTSFTMRGPGGGLAGQAWLYSDGAFVCNAAQIFLTAPRIDLNASDLRFYSLQTTSAVANLRLDSVGGAPVIKLVSSSARYKVDPSPAVIDPAEVLSLSGQSFVDKLESETLPEGTDLRRHVGFMAEHLDERPSLRQFVDYDEEGRPDAIQYDRLSVALLEVAKDQEARLVAMEQRLTALEAK